MNTAKVIGFSGKRGPGTRGKRNDHMRLACPECFGQKTHVVNSRPDGSGGRRRRYECLDCFARFTALEMPLDRSGPGTIASAELLCQALAEANIDILLAEIRRRAT